MASEPNTEDTGDPNVFTIYKGRYSVTAPDGVSIDNTAVMLTETNDVHLLGSALANGYAGGAIMVLPEECRPTASTAFPIVLNQNDTTFEVATCVVGEDGSLTVKTQLTDFLAMTRGVTFNIGGNFYIDEGV